jgi:NitT/TauT family transport system ATP-binding protein
MDATRPVRAKISREDAGADGNSKLHDVVVCKDVHLTYASRGSTVEAIRGLSLVIRQGEFVSLLGPSGCGKSTLLNLVGGLRRPSGGSIEVYGEPVIGPLTNLGIVFQQDRLLPWRSAFQNVMLQAEVRKIRGPERVALEGRAHDLMAMVGLAGFEGKLPSELSGGMRQRCSLVRALVHRPELLLMDEPFGALDAMTRDQLNLDMQDLWKQFDAAVLFVTHSIEEAIFLGDRVAIMAPRPGAIVQEIEVPFPRPRSVELRDEMEFRYLVRTIRDIFTGSGMGA